jgi:uncharacterized membrane protein
MTARLQLPPKPLWRLLVARIFTAVGAASAYLGLVAVVIILASSMMDGRPEYFGAAVYAMCAAALTGIFVSTVWALATAPGDHPQAGHIRTCRDQLGALGGVVLSCILTRYTTRPTGNKLNRGT